MARWVLLLLSLLTLVAWSQPDRAVSLKATRNTRDLGGLAVQGGQLRKGLIYRSGALCFLTASDVERINGLHLKTLVELRLPNEIAKDGPDRPALNGKRETFAMANSRGRGQEAYHNYIREDGEAIHSFFTLLSHKDAYPLLFHCSAGKDRTGILAALLLWSLGAERSVIEDDYLQSQRNAPGLVVKPEWIDEVFLYVKECGGIEAFLARQGVTPEELSRIRQILVEPTP